MAAATEAGLVIEGLRRWAQGCYGQEAAVELLVRAFHGRFATPGRPWIRPCSRWGWYYLDEHALGEQASGLSGGERRVLAIVEALLTLRVLDLADVTAGVDRQHLALILAALAHAGGSHQDVDWRTYHPLGALVSWPLTDAVVA